MILPLLLAQDPGPVAAGDGVEWLQLQQRVLPPELPWDGASRSLALQPGEPWVTPCETHGLRTTPRYAETVAWLDSLCDATPLATMRAIGTSDEGRTIWMVVVSTSGTTAEDIRSSGTPTLLAQACIHSGESDGKDAGMMLVRDLTVRGVLRPLLDTTNLLFIPILNVDGHERFGPYGRINQRGPEHMGWRTNALNLNLNRDWTKLDTPGARAVVRVLEDFAVDLYVDLHVTDGADYQYDITWGGNGPSPWSPNIEAWFHEVLDPRLEADLRQQGHVPGPLIFAVDGRNPEAGIVNWTAEPRFSNGYGDARHLPTILVENHSLKPYPQRVLGTRVFLETALRTLGTSAASLRRAVHEDQTDRPDSVALEYRVGPGPHPDFDFLGVRHERVRSAVSGDLYVRYLGIPERSTVPYLQRDQVVHRVSRPRAYWIPVAWHEVIERLAWHGVDMQTMESDVQREVEVYRLVDPQLESTPFEGRVRLTSSLEPERRTMVFPAGSVRIPTDQPLGTLVTLLLEPQSADSFFQWGFFLGVLQRTEYSEAYVTDPLAEAWMEQDADLEERFEQRLLRDAAFAADPQARRDWFYARTPWFDERWRLYPVARELE
jgi:hypothetical protein